MQEVLGVPARDEAAALEPGRLRGVPAQEAQGPAAERGEVRWTGVAAGAIPVFVEDHVERPVAGVLDVPVTADRMREGPDAGRQAGDEVASVLLGGARLRPTDVVPRGVDAADAVEVGPLGAIGEDGRRGDWASQRLSKAPAPPTPGATATRPPQSGGGALRAAAKTTESAPRNGIS